jgi:hypothetical protein
MAIHGSKDFRKAIQDLAMLIELAASKGGGSL